MTHHVHRWSISTSESDAMIKAKNKDVFNSNPFRIDDIEFVIKCFPNGDNQSCAGCVIILLQPTLIPTLWKQVRYCRRIKCVETECSNTAITHTINKKATGWDDETMSFHEFKQIIAKYSTITFEITVHVLEVSLRNHHILNVFPSNRSTNIAKQQALKWCIDSNLLNKIKRAHAGQLFESDIVNEMWCIKCSPSDVYLQLCSLPHHIKSMRVQYEFKCIETNAVQRESDLFSFDHQNSAPPNFMNMNELHSHDRITIVVHIEILQVNLQSEDNDNTSSDAMENKEISQHKGALNDLIECMKKQTQSPRYNRQTNKLQKLKKLVQSRYPANEIVIEQDHHEANAHLDKRAIVKYLQNNRDRGKGNILIECRHKRIKQSDTLEIFVAEENERNPALIGQKGLRSKVDIASGTVIGEYFGREFLENEFDDIFSGTQEFIDINEYALSACVMIKLRHSRLAFYTNTEMFYNGDENEVIKQQFNIVIDGLNKNSDVQAMLIYMNDCRKDINTTQKTIQDEQFQNVQLVTVNHNGWPKIFGVTIKNIKANDELLTFYGSSHVGWEQDRIRYEKNQKLLVGNIKQVLRENNIASDHLIN